ncbi:MAG: CDP-glucose 4,6-dehydratase [Aquabacterium sp.]|nr:CDP-glucose 4,6-dehydratase [Aquabacterium sp.]
MTAPSQAFWRGRRVLLTGHTGFKGGWLALWLQRLGADVTGLGLPPATNPSLFHAAQVATACRHRLVDVRDATAVVRTVQAAAPEIVLHLAAQPLVRASYQQPLETLATNVMGTAHVLDALRGLDGVRVAVVVTTDKVYRHGGAHTPGAAFRESDPLGGHDPYSASKAAAEIVAASYHDAFLRAQGVAVATARAGNVIGGGDWSQDRLLPDAVRAWQSGAGLQIRNPHAVRPWQHVLEPLAAYLCLAERLWHGGPAEAAYNFGPATADAACVGDVVTLASSAYGGGGWIDQHDPNAPHEADWLALDVSLAHSGLGVVPRWPLATAVQHTMQWYRRFADGADARALCNTDIDAYEAIA